MTNERFNDLMRKYKAYKTNGEFMNYREFIELFDELFSRYDTHN